MKNLDNKSLNILREALPEDGYMQIQDRLGEFTIDYIRKILYGKRRSSKVIEMALEVAREEKERRDALKKEIAELASI